MRLDRSARLALGLLLCTALHAGAAESNPPDRFADPDRHAKLAAAFPEIERIVADFVKARKVPGAAVGVVIDGELAWAMGFGVRDVAAQAPADADTVFRIASMTKSFTALAILKLRDEGRLSLDDPAAKYVPELAKLAYPTTDAPVITIRHLLTHSAGFPEDNPWGDRQLAASQEALSQMLAGGIPFSNSPGVTFEYSNLGFAILGRIVSRVSGMSYRDYVDSQILKPLGMTSTRWEAASVPADRLARGYRGEGDSWVEETPLVDGAFGAMGGLYSSVRDLARYTAFFLSAWPPRDDVEAGPVRRSSAREMQQVGRPTPGRAGRETVGGPLLLSSGGYGYGLGASESCRFRQIVAHSGGLPGFGSQMRWLPQHGVAIVGLGNLTYTGWGRVVSEVLEALDHTGALQPRVVQPSPALLAAREGVNRLIGLWDDGLADRLAADNLFLDTPREARRQQLDELRARHGACHPSGEIDADNALRGRWQLSCERGRLDVAITLTPTQPPRVQHFQLTSTLPLGRRLAEVATQVAMRIGATPQAPGTELLAPNADAARATRMLAAAGAWGTCRLGDVQRDGGESQATVRLTCDKGNLDANLTLDAASGRLLSLTLSPAAGETCVP